MVTTQICQGDKQIVISGNWNGATYSTWVQIDEIPLLIEQLKNIKPQLIRKLQQQVESINNQISSLQSDL